VAACLVSGDDPLQRGAGVEPGEQRQQAWRGGAAGHQRRPTAAQFRSRTMRAAAASLAWRRGWPSATRRGHEDGGPTAGNVSSNMRRCKMQKSQAQEDAIGKNGWVCFLFFNIVVGPTFKTHRRSYTRGRETSSEIGPSLRSRLASATPDALIYSKTPAAIRYG
jgi:hypothetical protein